MYCSKCNSWVCKCLEESRSSYDILRDDLIERERSKYAQWREDIKMDMAYRFLMTTLPRI